VLNVAPVVVEAITSGMIGEYKGLMLLMRLCVVSTLPFLYFKTSSLLAGALLIILSSASLLRLSVHSYKSKARSMHRTKISGCTNHRNLSALCVALYKVFAQPPTLSWRKSLGVMV